MKVEHSRASFPRPGLGRIRIYLLITVLCCLFPLPALSADSKGVATFIYGDREPAIPGLKRAWGFISLIEYDGKKILFNAAGVETIFKNNMEVLKIDPKELDALVISHEHWEMIKGLDYLFAANPKLPVYTTEKVIKMLTAEHPEWESHFQLVEHYEEFTPNIVFLNLKSGHRRGGPTGIYEVNIILKTDQGLVLFIGCGHPELLQVIHQSKQVTQVSSINLLAGGFHLLPESEHLHIDDSGEDFFVPQSFQYTEGDYYTLMGDLKAAGVTHVMPTHCTMEPAESIFKKTFGNNYIQQTLGMRLEFPVAPTEK